MSPRPKVTIPPKNSIAERLREFFVGKKYSDISQETGVKAGTIPGYLNGKQTPSADFLAATARLGGDVHYILTGERRAGVSPAPAAPVAVSGSFANVIRLLGELEKRNQSLAQPSAAWLALLQALETQLETGSQMIEEAQRIQQGAPRTRRSEDAG